MFAGYGMARCPAHADRTPSLRISDGHSATLFKCFGGCSSADVTRALRERLLLNGAPTDIDYGEAARQRDAEIAADRERRLRRAHQLWRDAVPADDTLVGQYLRSRSIRPPLPPSLRFHPECFCAEAGGAVPAMLALIKSEDGFRGVHRTYLDPAGGKAKLEVVKMMLGNAKGGAVRLSARTNTLVVAEGVETAMSLRDALLDQDVAVWAALSAPGMASLDLPDWCGEVVAAHDNDAPGRRAAEHLGERCAALGLRFRMMPPPVGHNDWNDAARAGVLS